MKFWTMVFLAAVIGVTARAGAEEREPPHTQLLVHVRVFEGEPFGNPDERKMLGEASLVTLSHRPCSWNMGANVAVPGGKTPRYVECGRKLQATPGELKDGKLELELALSNTALLAPLDDRTRLHTSQLRTFASIELGEVVTFDWELAPGEKATWVELLVDVVKP